VDLRLALEAYFNEKGVPNFSTPILYENQVV
jgi:hypothetical protein